MVLKNLLPTKWIWMHYILVCGKLQSVWKGALSNAELLWQDLPTPVLDDRPRGLLERGYWRETFAHLVPWCSAVTGSDKLLEGSFSAVSKPNFASKYAFESSRRDLHNALLCTVLVEARLGEEYTNTNMIIGKMKSGTILISNILSKLCDFVC